MPFWPSIMALTLAQACLVGIPAEPPPWIRWIARRRSRWWALILPGSIAAVIAILTAAPNVADGLTYLALVGVPPLAALALATLAPRARPAYALAVPPLFALAWLSRDSLVGEASALLLSALACVALASVLVALAPGRWVRAGIYAMAVVDSVLVIEDLLQAPNAVLEHAAPAAGLPQLQSVVFGSATMGFGDLFIAATLGALLVASSRPRGSAVLIAAVLGLSFDSLFTLVDLLPTTVPIALTLAVLDAPKALVHSRLSVLKWAGAAESGWAWRSRSRSPSPRRSPSPARLPGRGRSSSGRSTRWRPTGAS